MGGVPYLIYNKELMSKYNGDAALPTCYSEYKALLKKAYDGEIATKTDFKSIVTNRSWTFKEGACATTFFQNDAPYYVYKDGAYVNEWNEGSETLSDATTAMQNSTISSARAVIAAAERSDRKANITIRPR